MAKVHDGAKRVFDVTIASLLLVLELPLQLATALAIRIRLGSPVLFKQTHSGLNGEPFEIAAFRTIMPLDAALDRIGDASRMTSLGHRLRATSIDELPTLLNIIRGDMSLVSPRPLLMRYLARYSPEQTRRPEVRAGLTALAQVSGRNALSWEDKLRLGLEYVDNHTFMRDLKIIRDTVSSVARRDGISASGKSRYRSSSAVTDKRESA